MNRIEQQFKKAPAYVAYLTAGDGGIQRSLDAMLALVEGGVNILEVGVPFSDPVADGPVIQQAAMRALSQKTKLRDVFNLITEFRKHSEIPIILFTYFNPLLAAGDEVYKQMKLAGIDGCLVVDLPIEEAAQHHAACKTAEIAPILLISPSTTDKRIKKINEQGQGMLYYVCRPGTTGIQKTMPENFQEKMTQLKSMTTLPIVTGFGIANRQMATQALQHADGFVIGSLFVKAIAEGTSSNALTTLARSIDPRF